jgi:integrase
MSAAPAAQSHAHAHPPRQRKALTPIAITKLKPQPYRYEVGDPGAQGLRILVTPTGHKSFVLRYRFAGRPQKLTVGPVLIGLAAARKEAAKAIYELAQGRDPAAGKRAIKEEQRRAALAVEDTFYSVSERLLQLEGHKLRSADARRKRLERLVYPVIGHRPIAEIRRSEVVRLLDKIETNNGPAMAHAVLAIIRRTMSWYASRSDAFANPLAVRGLGRVNAKERVRERTLNDDEIRRLWKAADGFEGPEGRFIQFLLLTAARRSEAAGLRFDELSGSDWLLPAARNKVKTELLRPLSVAAMEVLAKTPRISDEFVFSTGARPLDGFSRFKKKLDAASGVTNWTLHDCRRTARTLLARAGIASEIAERCLGHLLPAIESTYNKHTYHAEMQRAFEALAQLIERITNPTDNIVSMRG